MSDPESLYDRPGYLIRRAHQLSVSMFLEASGGTTPTQYGVLVLVAAGEQLDQIGVARRLGLDRSTAGLVVKNLVDAGWVTSRTDPSDRRRRTLSITPKGRARLKVLAEPVRRERERLLAPFSEEEAGTLLALLRRFVDAHHATSRVPHVQPPRPRPGTQTG